MTGVLIIESYGPEELPVELLTVVVPGCRGFPSEPRVWGIDCGRYRLIPVSWLPTGEAIRRGFEHLISPAVVAEYRAFLARTGGQA
ncbi:MAG: hypothetical protein MUE83_00860 [Tabrizicola sp.]|jgi:hypothetical protein|nr:hypothetical protein [Tabrizicola sp.]